MYIDEPARAYARDPPAGTGLPDSARALLIVSPLGYLLISAARHAHRSRRRIALLSRIRIVERTGSTNADLIADATVGEGDWLVALEQDSGRGRQGRAWTSSGGNFHGSTVVELREGDPQPQTLSLVAGLALIEAIDLAVPGQALMLKWPNDVMLLGRKLAGIFSNEAEIGWSSAWA